MKLAFEFLVTLWTDGLGFHSFAFLCKIWLTLQSTMPNIYKVTAFHQILECLGFKLTAVEYIHLQGFKTMSDLVSIPSNAIPKLIKHITSLKPVASAGSGGGDKEGLMNPALGSTCTRGGTHQGATAETKWGAREEKSGDDQPTTTGTNVPIIFPYLAVRRLQALCALC